MSRQGEPGHPGLPGEEGTGGGGRGGAGGAGGRGGAGDITVTRGTRYAVMFLFLFVAAVGGANLLFTARQVNNVRALTTTAAANTASVMQLCQAGNVARTQQIVLWEHIITISRPPAHETPAQERARLTTLRAFDTYLHRVFAPRDCHAITH